MSARLSISKTSWKVRCRAGSCSRSLSLDPSSSTDGRRWLNPLKQLWKLANIHKILATISTNTSFLTMNTSRNISAAVSKVAAR